MANSGTKKKILKHFGNVCMAVISLSLMISPVFAMDTSEAAKVIGSEGGKKAAKKPWITNLRWPKVNQQ